MTHTARNYAVRLSDGRVYNVAAVSVDDAKAFAARMTGEAALWAWRTASY